MNREEGSNKSAAPKSAGDAAQPKEKQNRGDRVQQNICKMVAASFEIVELTVDHVRDDREGMPVGSVSVDERS